MQGVDEYFSTLLCMILVFDMVTGVFPNKTNNIFLSECNQFKLKIKLKYSQYNDNFALIVE